MSATPHVDIPAILPLRKHISIIHHVRGRIRLRFGAALWGMAAKVQRDNIQHLLQQIPGIHQLRLNAAVASVVIEYDPQQIQPTDWETLLQGDNSAASQLIESWLNKYSYLLNEIKE